MKANKAPHDLAAALLPALLLAGAVCFCDTSFDPWGDDSSLRITWRINNVEADAATCEAAGASFVRMSINKKQEPWYDSLLEWECSRNWALLIDMFREGEYYSHWELLDANREIIIATPWMRMFLEYGMNEEDINFNIE